MYNNYLMQTSQKGDQLYSDTSPKCSLNIYQKTKVIVGNRMLYINKWLLCLLLL